MTQDFKQKPIKQAFTLGSDWVNNIGLDFSLLKKQNQRKTHTCITGESISGNNY